MTNQAPGSRRQASGPVRLLARSRDNARSLEPAAWSRCGAALIIACLASLTSVPARAADAPRTLRLDFFHTGSATEERFSVDRLVLEPLPWPGNPARPLDDTNLGKYLFEVIDRSSNRVLYSRGFASIYGEWETTGEAKTVTRTFGESLRFPLPAVTGAGRREEARCGTMRSARCGPPCVDPADIFIDRSPAPIPGALDPAARRAAIPRARWTC